jgi:hypothetical protein
VCFGSCGVCCWPYLSDFYSENIGICRNLVVVMLLTSFLLKDNHRTGRVEYWMK